MFHVKTATAETVREFLLPTPQRTSELHTDESKLYPKVGQEFAAHKTVEHGCDPSAAGMLARTANHQRCRKFLRQFQAVNEGHLSLLQRATFAALPERISFRHNHRAGLGFNDGERTAIAIKGIEGKRLTYRTTN